MPVQGLVCSFARAMQAMHGQKVMYQRGNIVLQVCQPMEENRYAGSATRCLSDLQQLSLQEPLQQPHGLPTVSTLTSRTEQCSEAAALAAAAWPSGGLPLPIAGRSELACLFCISLEPMYRTVCMGS